MTTKYQVLLPEQYRKSIKWLLTSPIRFYLRNSPLRRGAGMLDRLLVAPLTPREWRFDVILPCGATIEMGGHELIGRYLLTYREFETAELIACREFIRPGSCAIDVGANVGIFTMTMAASVGAHGNVLAIEPLPANGDRLRRHAAANDFKQVSIYPVAAGASSGEVILDAGADPAFVSTRPVRGLPERSAGEVRVPMVALDDVWVEANSPSVSFIKIDVEGGECAVLDGAKRLLDTCRPTMLLEITGPTEMGEIRRRLSTFGYRFTQPSGFQTWNYIASVN